MYLNTYYCRSFVPMLTLFSAYGTPESQHWATWEVCNMIIKDRKYTFCLDQYYNLEKYDNQIVVVW